MNKHRTEIGAGAFIGSDTALVAPVRVGARALVAAGSVITEDVPDDALAIARGRQANKPGRGFQRQEGIELMCGIVGVVGKADAAPLLLEALRRLEYRGYDSAGIATLVDGHVERRRAEGKLGNLAAVLERDPLSGTTGIGHTRWATHGAPTERNAHPHSTARVSVVHNGIIENHAELRAELEAKGAVFETETDTETFVRLLDDLLAQGLAPQAAFAAALKRVHGAFALAAIFAGHPKLLMAARQGAPLAIGFGEGEMFVGSDALALAPLTRRIAYLEEGDWAVLDTDGAAFFDAARPCGRAQGGRHRRLRRRGRQGQLPPLHGEGAARAPGGAGRHAAAIPRPEDAGSAAATAALRPGQGAAADDLRLRQRLPRRPGRRCRQVAALPASSGRGIAAACHPAPPMLVQFLLHEVAVVALADGGAGDSH